MMIFAARNCNAVRWIGMPSGGMRKTSKRFTGTRNKKNVFFEKPLTTFKNHCILES
jgi:hypothetical protein